MAERERLGLGGIKTTSKVWNPTSDWMTWFRQQSEGIN